MGYSSLGRGILFSVCFAVGCFSAISARAGDMVDNHKYQVWAKFKPGSSSTIATDMEKGTAKFHLEMTRTLISIDSDNAVVETVSKVTVMGQEHAAPARRETIPVKIDKEKDSIKETGDKDIDAMGKTFKCKVFEATGDPDAPAAHGPAANPDTMKATVYISEDVPGGLVRLDSNGQDGKAITFILTAMESK
jgi:hypothetical protein